MAECNPSFEKKVWREYKKKPMRRKQPAEEVGWGKTSRLKIVIGYYKSR